jgi:hypothetical protein
MANVKRHEFIIGKGLPYFVASLLFGMTFLWFQNRDLLYQPFVYLIIMEITLLYLSLSCLNGLLARSNKEYSFLNVFSIAGLSLYLLIPGFLANVSELSYASLLTPLLLFAQGAEVQMELLLFVIPAYLFVGIIIIAIASRAWDYEELFRFDTPWEKVLMLISHSLNKMWHFFIFGMGAVAFGWLGQLALIIVLLTVNLPGKLVVFFIIGAFIEEFLRNLGVYSILKYGKEKFTGWKKMLLISAATGLGFMIAEKGLLVLSIAPFLEGYELLVTAGLVVPFLLHTGFTLLYIILVKNFKVMGKHYLLTTILIGALQLITF